MASEVAKPWWRPRLDPDGETGRRYDVTWDHVGDAYEQYEPTADALLAAEARALELRTALDLADQRHLAEKLNEREEWARAAIENEDRARAAQARVRELEAENAVLLAALEANRDRAHHEDCCLELDEIACWEARNFRWHADSGCKDAHGPCDCGQAEIDAALAATAPKGETDGE